LIPNWGTPAGGPDTAHLAVGLERRSRYVLRAAVRPAWSGPSSNAPESGSIA